MYNSNIPSDREVPSTRKLIKSTIVAAVVALALLITVVLPAEYGIDPTGIGSLTGLTRMGEIKMSLAREAETETDNTAIEEAVARAVSEAMAQITLNNQANDEIESETPNANLSSEINSAINSHEMTLTLAPDESGEIKVVLAEGASVDYSWETDGGAVNFDVHGDSSELNIRYHPYYKGTDQQREGNLVADFDGAHGWFWRNRTDETVNITIRTSGEYTEIVRY